MSVCLFIMDLKSFIQCMYLEFVLFPVDNHCSDLLIHKYQNGDQKCRKCSSQVNPPGVPTKRWDKPAPMWTCRLKKKYRNRSERVSLAL